MESTQSWFVQRVRSISFGSDFINIQIFLFQADIFQEFTIKEDLVGFQINLTVLLDCLNIFGGSAVPGKDKENQMAEWAKKKNIYINITLKVQ